MTDRPTVIGRKLMERCLVCRKDITNKNGSPYSVCYDPHWETNVWGGDSHKHVGYLCENCGKKLVLRAEEWAEVG
jgi:predicted RNA-binding Zn-ribbon protein involved in translation (DUF1610 family)